MLVKTPFFFTSSGLTMVVNHIKPSTLLVSIAVNVLEACYTMTSTLKVTIVGLVGPC